MQRFSIILLLLCFIAVPATSQNLPSNISSYVLGVGDTINVVVFEEPDMSFDIKIDESGVFAYPYLNNIQLSGKTTEQLESFIADGLVGRVLINPNVSVSISEYRSFSIGGEVKNPGSYPYQPGLNIQKAINIAGGLTEWASSSRFKLDKEDGSAFSERLSIETLVSPGDTITVQPRRF